ncbi:MAG TPA: hemerythrin domain-containing protein [Acidimicrobiales bacterium]|nr:hemerythrin domain-containing protein [Acidimicrobiales bacterium]
MPDPIAMLEEDHRRVEQLFEQYANGQDPMIAQQICMELKVHTTVEEQEIYPTVKSDVPEGKELEEEAEKEHAEVEALIKQVEQKGFDDPSVPELMLKIEEGVSHHVEEEETEMFPKMRDTLGQQTLDELGQKAADAKQRLLQQQSGQGSTVEGELTKEELYQKAKEQDVDGRSKMDKDELQQAVGEQ